MVLTRLLLLYTSNNGKLCGIIAFAHYVICAAAAVALLDGGGVTHQNGFFCFNVVIPASTIAAQ